MEGHSFILFYPFCAVFTLYEHIIACTDPDACEDDVRQLELVAAAMEHTSRTIRADLKPFATTIKALNRVSRTIQESRRGRRPGMAAEMQGGLLQQQQQQQQHAGGVGGSGSGVGVAAGEVPPIPDLDISAFDTFPDFPMTMDGDPDPLGFVRALESDFIARNWHEEWWDLGGGMDGVMSGGGGGGGSGEEGGGVGSASASADLSAGTSTYMRGG